MQGVSIKYDFAFLLFLTGHLNLVPIADIYNCTALHYIRYFLGFMLAQNNMNRFLRWLHSRYSSD